MAEHKNATGPAGRAAKSYRTPSVPAAHQNLIFLYDSITVSGRTIRGTGPRTAPSHHSSRPWPGTYNAGPAPCTPYQKSSTWLSVPYSFRRDFPMNFSLAMSRSNTASSIQSSATLTLLEKVGTLER